MDDGCGSAADRDDPEASAEAGAIPRRHTCTLITITTTTTTITITRQQLQQDRVAKLLARDVCSEKTSSTEVAASLGLSIRICSSRSAAKTALRSLAKPVIWKQRLDHAGSLTIHSR
jgi:hypothetical protein